MKFPARTFALFCLLALCLPATWAQKPEKAKSKQAAQAAATPELDPALLAAIELTKDLKYQTGKITLKDGLATLQVPEGFHYLDPEGAETVLVKLWGNPPRERTLGMLFPEQANPADAEAWGVVITYEEDGYVKDDDAAKINYTELLKEMKEGTQAANEERAKAGYPAVVLVGWAAQPHYDQAAHKLYWAKELQFAGQEPNVLNYDIRALGRRGVLSLNAVGAMPQLATIETDMQKVLAAVEFNAGHRYSDYQPGTDKLAAYGIGALIAGKLAAKAGLFKILIGLLVAGKKFILIALIAVGALAKRLFTKKSNNTPEPVSITGTTTGTSE